MQTKTFEMQTRPALKIYVGKVPTATAHRQEI